MNRYQGSAGIRFHGQRELLLIEFPHRAVRDWLLLQEEFCGLHSPVGVKPALHNVVAKKADSFPDGEPSRIGRDRTVRGREGEYSLLPHRIRTGRTNPEHPSGADLRGRL